MMVTMTQWRGQWIPKITIQRRITLMIAVLLPRIYNILHETTRYADDYFIEYTSTICIRKALPALPFSVALGVQLFLYSCFQLCARMYLLMDVSVSVLLICRCFSTRSLRARCCRFVAFWAGTCDYYLHEFSTYSSVSDRTGVFTQLDSYNTTNMTSSPWGNLNCWLRRALRILRWT